MRTYPNTCRRDCCWSPQGVCHHNRNCACHRRAAAESVESTEGIEALMRQEWS